MSSLEIHIEKKKKANRITQYCTLLATGIGFIPFPVVDAAGILGIQLWMISRFAKIYQVPFKKHLVKSFIGSLVGNLSSISIIKFIPALGSLLGGGAIAVSSGAATYALGKIFTQHFDQGGTLLDFDPVQSQAYFRTLYEEGKASVKELQQQEDGFKDAHTQAIASISTLKQTNEELKATIEALQQQLQQGKKDRKFALAALQEKKQKRFRWIGVPALILLIGVIGWSIQSGYIHFNYFQKEASSKHVETKAKSTAKATTLPTMPLKNQAYRRGYYRYTIQCDNQ